MTVNYEVTNKEEACRRPRSLSRHYNSGSTPNASMSTKCTEQQTRLASSEREHDSEYIVLLSRLQRHAAYKSAEIQASRRPEKGSMSHQVANIVIEGRERCDEEAFRGAFASQWLLRHAKRVRVKPFEAHSFGLVSLIPSRRLSQTTRRYEGEDSDRISKGESGGGRGTA